ncbi:MAG: response regulator, partial [Anaerolineae bacterium]|nr:response regulator [Anaerolineae bacterium]
MEKSSNEKLYEANEKITRLYQQTRELEQVKNNFFAEVSHKLRTPLTLILLPVRKHLALGQLTEKQREDLQIVERNAQLLYRQVNDLLEISRLEAGHILVEYSRIDLAHLTRVLISHFETILNEKKILYAVKTPASLFAEVDAEKYQRILMYSISNLIKLAPENSQIHLGLEEVDSMAVIQMELVNLPDELLPQIISPYQSLNSTDQDVDDLAVDLTIVREFINLHHGLFSFEKRSEAGLKFNIQLPMEAPAGSQIMDAPNSLDEEIKRQVVEDLEPHQTVKRAVETLSNAPLVLVVEDNPDMNAFIAEILGEFYRVMVAFNGKEGLAKTRENEPDLIISDVMMPLMDGDQMVLEIRREPKLLEIPIVMLTAKADDELRVRLLKDSVQDYLYKPFSVAELLARCERLVSEKKRREASIHEAYGLLHTLVESIPDVVFVKDMQGRYLTINEAGTLGSGQPVDQIIGKTDVEILPPLIAQHLVSEDEEVKNRAERLTFEKREIIDGKPMYFLSTKAPFYNHQGEIAGVLGITRNVTELKLAEEKIKKLNRVLAVLSNTNQAIVRIRDLDVLFNRACNIAFELGGFPMAWIILVDQKINKVRIAAYRGLSDLEMENLTG